MLNETFTVSVVIPLYNKRDSIVETLHSVLAQTRPADEIIVVDDGSSDGSDKLVEEVFAKQVTLIKRQVIKQQLIRQQNSGVSAARNCGVYHASSEYIAFLDADDLWAPHYLEEVQRLAVQFPQCGLIGTRYQYIDADAQFSNAKIRFGSVCLQDSQEKNSHSNAHNNAYSHAGILPSYFAVAARGDLPFNASTVTLKKALLNKLNGFPVNEPMGEDQDVWAGAAIHSEIAYSAKVLGFYNRAAENRACNNLPPKQECPFSRRLHVYAQQCSDKQLASDIVDYTAAHLCYLAKQNIMAGQLDSAQALLEDPRCTRKLFKKMMLDILLLKYRMEESIGDFYRRSLAMMFNRRLFHSSFVKKEVKL